MKKITITLVFTLFIGFVTFAQSNAPAKTVNQATAEKVEAVETAKDATAEVTKKSCSKAKASCCAHGKKAEADKASNDAETSVENKAVASTNTDGSTAKDSKKGCCSKSSAKASSCHGSKASTMASAENDEKTEIQPTEPKVEKQ